MQSFFFNMSAETKSGLVLSGFAEISESHAHDK